MGKGLGYYVRRTLKATLGGMIAGLTTAGLAAQMHNGHLTLVDGIYIASSFFSTMGVVFGVGNADPLPPE